MPDHLSADDNTNILAYVSYLADLMGIPSTYQIVLMEKTSEEYSGVESDGDDLDDDHSYPSACVHVREKRYTAELYISKQWGKYTQQCKTNTLIHELYHILHKRLDVLFEEWTSGRHVSFNDSGNAHDDYTRDLELFIDQAAFVLAPLVIPYPVEYDAGRNIVLEGNDSG